MNKLAFFVMMYTIMGGIVLVEVKCRLKKIEKKEKKEKEEKKDKK